MCGQFPHLPSWLLHKGLLAGLFDHSQKKAPELKKKHLIISQQTHKKISGASPLGSFEQGTRIYPRMSNQQLLFPTNLLTISVSMLTFKPTVVKVPLQGTTHKSL
jgi:hypothetical protein